MLLAGHGIDHASKLKPKYTISQVQNYCINYFNTSSEVTEEFKRAWKTIDITKNYTIGYYDVYSYRIDDTISSSRTIYYMDGKVYDSVYDPSAAVSNTVYDKTTQSYFSDYVSPTWVGWKTKSQIKYNWNDPSETIYPIETADIPMFVEKLYTKERNKENALEWVRNHRKSLYSNQKVVGTKYTTSVLFFPVLSSTVWLNGIKYSISFDLYYGEISVGGITDAVRTPQYLERKKQENRIKAIKKAEKEDAEGVLHKVIKSVDYFRYGCLGLSILVFLLSIFTSVDGFNFASIGGYLFLLLGGAATWFAGATSHTCSYGDFDDLGKNKVFKIVIRCIKNAWRPLLFAVLGLIFIWVSSTFFCGENLFNRDYSSAFIMM